MKNDLSLFKQFAKHDGQQQFTDEINSVVYTRVSTKEQAENNNSLNTQLKYCNEHCHRRGYSNEAFFGGTYESAKDDERKEFQRMINFVKRSKKKIHVIVVYNFDRFSRSGANAIYIASELKKRGIAVESVTQPTEAFTPGGELQQNIYFSFSQYENSTRRKRMMDGVKEALEAGKWPTKPPFGYTAITENGSRRIVVNEDGELLRKAFRWKLQYGIENTVIVGRLQAAGCKMYPQKLKKIFQNPFYCGLMVHRALNGEVVAGTHPPIVSRRQFLKLNGVVTYSQDRGKAAGKEYPFTPLRSLVFCEKCGRQFTAYSRTKKSKKLRTEDRRAVYQYSKPYHYYKCPTTGCGVNLNANALHTAFLDELKALQLPVDLVPLAREIMLETWEELNAENVQLVADLKGQLRAVEAEIEELDERLYAKEVPMKIYDKFSGKLEDKKFEILDALEKASEKISNPQKYIDTSLEYAANLPVLWENRKFSGRQKLQKLVFPEGIYFCPQKRVFRTPRVNLIIAQCAQISQKNGQKKRGFKRPKSSESPSAEMEGFEPPVGLPPHRISSAARSTTPAHLRCKDRNPGAIRKHRAGIST